MNLYRVWFMGRESTLRVVASTGRALRTYLTEQGYNSRVIEYTDQRTITKETADRLVKEGLALDAR